MARVYSNVENAQGNLHFLDYRRIKAAEDEQKKEPTSDPPTPFDDND